jgi:hypothetical protein
MSRVFLVLVCAAFATACGTSHGPSGGASSGAGGGSGSAAGGDAGGHCACASTEMCCLGQGLTCVAPGSCQGIPLVEGCSVLAPCQGTGVCCSTFLGPDGAPVGVAAFDGGIGRGMAGPSSVGSISTECKTDCVANSASLRVCDATTMPCPSGFTCQRFPQSPLDTQYCLPPATVPDSGSTSDAATGDASVTVGLDASDGGLSQDASAPDDVTAKSDVSPPNDASPQESSAGGG